MKPANKKTFQQYKDHLWVAYKHNYTYNLPTSILQKLDQIYFDETGVNLKVNFTCSHCVLNLLSKCGKLYYTQYPDEAPKK